MENRALLDRLAEALLSKETLLRSEIEEIIGAVENEEVDVQPEPALEAVEEIAEMDGSERDGSIAPPPPKPSIAPPVNGNGSVPQPASAQG